MTIVTMNLICISVNETAQVDTGPLSKMELIRETRFPQRILCHPLFRSLTSARMLTLVD